MSVNTAIRLACWSAGAVRAGARRQRGVQAHPHVRIVAASELIYASDGSITGVRHAWTFDDMFSTYALQGIETKTKGVYSREELAPLAQTNVESLKEFGFFTFARADGKKEKFQEPVDYFLEYKDALLTLHFTLPLKTPVKPKQLALEVFDPSFFIDFKFADKDPVRLVGAPAACRMKFQRPNDGTAASRELGEEDFAGDRFQFSGMMSPTRSRWIAPERAQPRIAGMKKMAILIAKPMLHRIERSVGRLPR